MKIDMKTIESLLACSNAEELVAIKHLVQHCEAAHAVVHFVENKLHFNARQAAEQLIEVPIAASARFGPRIPEYGYELYYSHDQELWIFKYSEKRIENLCDVTSITIGIEIHELAALFMHIADECLGDKANSSIQARAYVCLMDLLKKGCNGFSRSKLTIRKLEDSD